MIKKNMLPFSASVLVLSIASVCSAAAAEEHSAFYDQFRNEDCKEYQYLNIAWDSSVEEVIKVLPYEIKEVDLGIPPEEGTAVYQSRDSVEFDGQDATAEFEFLDNKLNTVTLTVSYPEEDYEEWFEEQAEALAEAYGPEAKKSDNKTDFFDSKIYQWKENDTLMQVDLLTGESFEPIVRFGVSRFSE